MSVKFHEVVPLRVDEEYQYYASNDNRFAGTIQIPINKVSNFESACKNGKISVAKWNDRLIQDV